MSDPQTDDPKARLKHLAREVIRTDGSYSHTRNFHAAINPHLVLALIGCVEALEKGLRDSGCDGDLCMYQWHEAARCALAEFNEATQHE